MRNRSENRSSGETDTGSVQTLKQIEDHERAIIELKRTRNSLLNISELPPEVLGDIFRWNVIPTDDLWGWEVRCHSFLFVCHHWFEVASRTPELWSFWGTTLKEWKICCRHSKTAPLDLVLDGVVYSDTFDVVLRDALQDRATRDTIRRIHLRSRNSRLLSSVISSLTINCNTLRPSSVESFILLNDSSSAVGDSSFFDRYRFPKLQRLELIHSTPTWEDYPWSQTGALTTLRLESGFSLPFLTASQVLSIFTSNPTLREVSLSVCASPSYSDDGSHSRVPLHHLKKLDLSGDVRDAVGVLKRLDHAGDLNLHLSLHNCVIGDISQVIGPYLGDYIGRRGRSPTGLGLCIYQDEGTIKYITGYVGNLGTPSRDRVAWFAHVEIDLNETPLKGLLERVAPDLLAHTPQEEVIYFHVLYDPTSLAAIFAQFLNIRVLRFYQAPLSTLSDLVGDGQIFPSLQYAFLDRVEVDDDDWNPLVTSLARRASSGNQLGVLEIFDSSHMCTKVEGDIRGVVRRFQTEGMERRLRCPFNTCSEA